MEKPSATCAPDANPKAFQESLIRWFAHHGAVYPWRQTDDPYAILVSEVMLQQTQIRTVLQRGHYARWLRAFPDFATLATAPEDAVLKAWEGLGYYRRARHLQQLAQVVMDRHGGRLPASPEAIRALPGIGPYTEGALLAFAFRRPAPLVDGNVARVMARLFDDPTPVDTPAGQKLLWQRAERLVSLRDPRAYNSGLMELGQQRCFKTRPSCHDCPVAGFCLTRDPQDLPVKATRRKTVFLDEHAVFAIARDRLLLSQEKGSRRRGLWKLPERDAPHLREKAPLVYRAKYSITHHRVTLHVYAPRDPVASPVVGERWHRLEELPGLALASPYRRAVDTLLSEQEGFQLG